MLVFAMDVACEAHPARSSPLTLTGVRPTLAAANARRYNAPMSAVAPQFCTASLANEAATADFAAALAPFLKPGDVVALDGDLGAGKTAFARTLINALPGEPEDVPSPTFTLVQTYERGGMEIWHFDLYRLEAPDEALELCIEDAFLDAVSLIEWPDKLGPLLPRGVLRVTLSNGATETAREIALSGDDNWAERLGPLAEAWGRTA